MNAVPGQTKLRGKIQKNGRNLLVGPDQVEGLKSPNPAGLT